MSYHNLEEKQYQEHHKIRQKSEKPEMKCTLPLPNSEDKANEQLTMTS